MAPALIAWVQTLADKNEETTFLCLETGFDGSTAQAVREALGETGDRVSTLIAIDDPMSVARVREYVRKRNIRLLVTGPFTLPAVGGKDQTADELVRASSCQTFALLYGEKAPSEIKRVLFVPTGREHDRSTLQLVETLRQRGMAQVTIGAIEDETGAKAGQTGERYIRALLHEEALDVEAFEAKVVVDRLKHRGVMALFEDHDLIVTGVNAVSRVSPLRQSLGDTSVALVKRPPPLSKRALADWLPRINPADHADLLHDLSTGSVWGPDFIGMFSRSPTNHR